MNKKTYKNLILIVCLTFLFVTIVTGFALKPKETKAYDINRDTITILEIQPGNRFMLTEQKSGSNPSATSGQEKFKNKVNGKTIIVDHITMAEYISKVDQINGKYDIVVIGNYSGLSGDNFVYKAPFQEVKPTYLPYGKEVRNTNNSYGLRNDSRLVNKTYIEYYSENDITNKRANEILDLINSGQLVYIANEAINVNGSKISSNFKNVSRNNLKKVNNNNITINNIVNNYSINKRPILTITNKTGDDNRNINLTFDINAQDDSPINVQLYLDLNGDGLFKDKELVKNIAVTPTNGQVRNGSISYNLQNEFIGVLTWKLEINSNNVKTYEIGNLKYNNSSNKPTVKVLQVYPSGNILKLWDDSRIRSFISQINDYNLQISGISVSDFNSKAGNTLKLNGNYDMVILGFQDSYGSADLTENAIEELKDFIKTGQSVMFTHDTLTYRILPNEVVYNDFKNKNSKNITYAFRDIIGQSRYKDSEYNSSELDIYKKYNVGTGLYENRIIPHDNSSDVNKITYGLSDGILKKFANDSNAGSYSGESNQVYKVNDGLITQYPFAISDIGVANTHYQWYQLNLEDEDVVPWYTLKPNGNGYNQYDARNYYYTYSKGNITYSGTGHSSGFTDDEKKLFINTMIKATRGANHAPTLVVNNLNNGAKYSKNQESIQFSVVPSDIDNDKLTTTITIKNASGNIVGQPIIYSNRQQGQAIDVGINSEEYDLKSMGGKMTVEVVTEDPLGAKSEVISRTVNLVNDPTISIASTLNKQGYLKGDIAQLTLTALSNVGGIDGKVTNIKFVPERTSTEQYKLSSSEILYNDVTFSNGIASVVSQPKTVTVEIKDGNNMTIPGNLIYIYNGQEIVTPYTITLNAQAATINISIIDDNGQQVNGGVISTTSPNGIINNTINYIGATQTFNNMVSGDYTFTLAQNFEVNGVKYNSTDGATKTETLTYNPSKSVYEIVFKVSSTSGPSVSLRYSKENGYLKGDNVNISIDLTTIAGDSTGTIKDVVLKLNNKDVQNLTIDKNTINFNDVTMNKNSKDNIQSSPLNVTFINDGIYTIEGKLSYKIVVGNVERSYIDVDCPLRLEAKAGSLKVSIGVTDNATNTTALNAPIILTLKNLDNSERFTQTLASGANSYTFRNLATGRYEVTTECPEGYTIVNTTKSVTVNYNNNSPEIKFDYNKISPDLYHGIYQNGKINSNVSQLTQNTNGTFGIEIRTFENNPELQLVLDDKLKNNGISDVKIIPIDNNGDPIKKDDGSQVVIDIQDRVTRTSNTEPYTINLSGIVTNNSKVDSSKLKHYIVVYTVKFGSEDSYTNTAYAKGIDGGRSITVRCGDLPDLF